MEGEYHRPVCVETVVGAFHHFSVEGWGRQQQLQKNGLPQGSVLSPTLFNIYTNDQPVHDGTRSFIYADDLCITAQFPTLSLVESTIEALG